jgi:hypothetical protein
MANANSRRGGAVEGRHGLRVEATDTVRAARVRGERRWREKSRAGERWPGHELGGEGAEHRKQKPRLRPNRNRKATLRPDCRGSGRKEGRPHRVSQAGWSPTPREQGESVRAAEAKAQRLPQAHSLTRASTPRQSRQRGRCGALPARMGSGRQERRQGSRAGKVFSLYQSKWASLDSERAYNS